MKKLNAQKEHDFVIPANFQGISIDEGLWTEFESSPGRLAQLEADKVSYLWDRMSERFAGHILAGTGHSNEHSTVSNQEKSVRMMAREPRLRRRMLAEAVVGLIQKTPPNLPLFRATRVCLPSRPGDPFYVFLLFSGPENESPEKCQLGRRNLLELLCMVTKLEFPDAQDIVGYATDPGSGAGTREEAFCFDMKSWTAEAQVEAQEWRDKLGLLKQIERFETNFKEYPTIEGRNGNNQARFSKLKPRSMRNSPCPCGSNQKYKQCCLRRQ